MISKLISLSCIIGVVFSRSVSQEASGKQFAITCDAGQTIRVLEATYGLNCIGHTGNTVTANNALVDVSGECDGKETCTYTISHFNSYGDPAGGCAKEFVYNYVCIDGDFAVAMEFTNFPAASGDQNDVGRDLFNALFADSGIIRRECPSCSADYQTIYYARTDDAAQYAAVDAYGLMRSWSGDNDPDGRARINPEYGVNALNVNFIMSNDVSTAVSRTSDWSYCNYNDAPVGAFRDCGKTGYVGGQWASVSGVRPSRFSIYLDDLCEQVTCDNGNLCETGSCVDGGCIYEAITCADVVCEDHVCDPDVGCVYTAIDCGDGDVCNGDESCDTSSGVCVSGNTLECPLNFICLNSEGGCVRDCDLFAIDGYLRDCSIEFEDQETELGDVANHLSQLDGDVVIERDRIDDNSESIEEHITFIVDIYGRIFGEYQNATIEGSGGIYGAIHELSARADAVEGDVSSLQTRVDTAEGDIDALEGRADANEARLTTAEADIDALEGRADTSEGRLDVAEADINALELMADSTASDLADLIAKIRAFGPLAERTPKEAKSQKGGAVGVYVPDGNGIGSLWRNYSDELMFLMFVTNMILVVCLVCMCYSSTKKRSRYERVVYSSADEQDAPLNQNK